MSFDTKQQVMEMASRTLALRVDVDSLQRADILGCLAARLHYGFVAARCASCDRIVGIDLYPGRDPPTIGREDPLWCDHCHWSAPAGRWTEEKFD